MTNPPDDCDDNICPECGGLLDPVSALVDGFADVADGHETSDVVEALCFMLGGILAEVPAGSRPKVRRQVGAILADATKRHVVRNCDA